MRIGIFSATMGSIQQEKSLGVIANNIANAATPGYKRNMVQFQNYMWQSTYTRMEQGRVRPTSNPLDIALDGQGFLRVQTDEGIMYTRAGNLTLNKLNQLATLEGWPVLGQSGPIRLDEEKKELRIERSGQVFDGDDQVDTLDVVQFDPGTQFERVNNGLFKPIDAEPKQADASKYTVTQGSLEEANFSVVEEMTRLIETMRMYEAYQKTMKFFDEQDSQMTNKLGSL